MDLHTHLAHHGDTFNEAEENEIEQTAATQTGRRRLTFFGEKEEDLNTASTEEMSKPTSNPQTSKPSTLSSNLSSSSAATDQTSSLLATAPEAKENKPDSVSVSVRTADVAAVSSAIGDKPLTEIPL